MLITLLCFKIKHAGISFFYHFFFTQVFKFELSQTLSYILTIQTSKNMRVLKFLLPELNITFLIKNKVYLRRDVVFQNKMCIILPQTFVFNKYLWAMSWIVIRNMHYEDSIISASYTRGSSVYSSKWVVLHQRPVFSLGCSAKTMFYVEFWTADGL
jgi:hypothetical protein